MVYDTNAGYVSSKAKALELAVMYKGSSFNNNTDILLLADMFLAYMTDAPTEAARLRDALVEDMKAKHLAKVEEAKKHNDAMRLEGSNALEFTYSSFTI